MAIEVNRHVITLAEVNLKAIGLEFLCDVCNERIVLLNAGKLINDDCFESPSVV